MEAIPIDGYGYKRNDLSSDLANPVLLNVTQDSNSTYFRIPAINDESSFRALENGRIVVKSVSYPVTGTSIQWPGGNEVIFTVSVSKTPTSTSLLVGSEFRLYDDDDTGLAEDPLDKLDLVNDQMKNYFKPSFVEVNDASAFNPVNRRLVAFHRNEDVSVNLYGYSSTVVASMRDLTDRNECWVCPLTAAYQGPQDADMDPSSGETRRDGESATYGQYDHSTVFVEDCRELYSNGFRGSPTSVNNSRMYLKKWITAVMSHEIGHHPAEQTEAVDHSEGGLMTGAMGGVSSATPENAKFSPTSILRFRKSNRWSK